MKKQNINYIKIFLIMSSLSIIFWSSHIYALEDNIDILQAIEIANKAMISDGRDLSTYEIVMAKKFKTAWNDVIQKNRADDYGRNALKKLKGKEYWLILYGRKGAILGGSIGIFVDIKTKEIIFIYRGK